MLFFFFVTVISITEGPVCVRVSKTKGRSCPFRLTNHFSSKDKNTLAHAHKHVFFLNKQPDALIIQIYAVIKLYMFRATFLPIIRSFLLYIRHW